MGTFAIENEPSARDVAVRPLSVVTVAPVRGLPPSSRTVPVAVVIGSGITFTITSLAVALLPARSVAFALIVKPAMPTGTL